MLSLGLRRQILHRTQVNFPVCLAPMVGLSHLGLRLLVRRYMPQGARTIWPTEMLNSRRLPGQTLGQTPETLKFLGEDGLVPQILGNEALPIQNSVVKLKEWGAVGVDINMGCPVDKALRHNYGVALMGDAGYAAEVVAMAKSASELPVSVKLRAGLTESDPATLKKFLLGLERAGAAWITLHPRLATQKRRGLADWGQIREARDQVSVPMIGNGDVQTAEDVIAMLHETACDMVMIGRALTARPWMVWQLGEVWGWPAPLGLEGAAPRSPEEEGREFLRAQLFLLSVMREHFAESLGVRKFLFQLKVATPWIDFGHAIWAKATSATSYQALEQVLLSFQDTTFRMAPRTELRY